MQRIFEFLLELAGWIQIAASPFLIGAGIGVFLYVSNPGTTTLVIAVSLSVIGLIIGSLWATKIWKTKGTIRFISRVMATPELDKADDKSISSKES